MNSEIKKMMDSLSELGVNINDIDLSTKFRDSLLGFFVFLATSDIKMKPSEIEYINSAFDFTIGNKETYLSLIAKSGIKKSDINKLPLIINDLVKAFENNYKFGYQISTAVGSIKDIFNKLGMELMSCDDKVSNNEIKNFTKYMNELNKISDEIHKRYINISLYMDDDDEEEYIEPVEEEVEEEPSLDELLMELDSLIGLNEVKTEIKSMVNLIKVRKIREERGLKNVPMSFHLVFDGNPGTGKTTVARLLAKIYKALGVLSSGHLVETDRSGLVAGYIGQTAIKTKEVISSAYGGVLFIDEAYSLTYNRGDNDYGIEAIDTLLKDMEDNRDDLIVIVAGYTEPMESFINSNPGLKSRFSRYIHFNDYSKEELYEIFASIAEKNNYKLSEKAKEKLLERIDFKSEKESIEFGNARGIRNIFEDSVIKQSSRIADISDVSNEELETIEEDDL